MMEWANSNLESSFHCSCWETFQIFCLLWFSCGFPPTELLKLIFCGSPNPTSTKFRAPGTAPFCPTVPTAPLLGFPGPPLARGSRGGDCGGRRLAEPGAGGSFENENRRRGLSIFCRGEAVGHRTVWWLLGNNLNLFCLLWFSLVGHPTT